MPQLCLSSACFDEPKFVKFGFNTLYNLGMHFAMPSGAYFTLLNIP
jgi:hypothetical protein